MLLIAAGGGGSEARADGFALGRKDWIQKSGLPVLMVAQLWEGVRDLVFRHQTLLEIKTR